MNCSNWNRAFTLIRKTLRWLRPHAVIFDESPVGLPECLPLRDFNDSLNTYDAANRVNIINNMYGEVRRRGAIVMKVIGFFTW